MRALVSLRHGAAATLLFSLAMGNAVQAHAAINVGVGCTAGVGDSAGLISAINLANAEGGGTIDLGAGCTYTFTQANNFWYGPDALPPIQSTIVIEGHGAALVAAHTGDPTPITANAFRFFYVSGGMESPAGSLTLHDLSLRGGYAKGGDSGYGGGGGGGAGMGGAIFNQGALTLDAVSLIANTAHGGNAEISATSGGGGGMGQDSQVDSGGGMGGALPGAFASLSTGGVGSTGAQGGGGGGGFLPMDNGFAATTLAGGSGGGLGGLGGSTRADGGTGGLNVNYQNPITSGSGGGFGGGGNNGHQAGGGGGIGGGGASVVCAENVGAGGGFGGGGGLCGGGGFGGGSGFMNTTIAFGGGGDLFTHGASGGSGMGGAIFNHTGNVRLFDVTLTDNAANGGSISSNGRYGSGLGAAIFNLNGSIEISFSTIYKNSVSGSNGAAIAVGPGDGAIYSLAYGNDIQNGSASVAILNIVNSIVYGTAGATHDVVNNSVDGQNANVALLGFGGSNIVGRYQNVSFFDANSTLPATANPQLGALSPYAGAPPTLPISASSPAYNAAGSCNDADGNPVTVDERGVAQPQFGQCDIGAYEFDGDYIFANGFD